MRFFESADFILIIFESLVLSIVPGTKQVVKLFLMNNDCTLMNLDLTSGFASRGFSKKRH